MDGAEVVGLGNIANACSVSRVLDPLQTPRSVILHLGDAPAPEDLIALNHEREQLRRQYPVVIRAPVEQAHALARSAPDLWKWATVLDLTNRGRPQLGKVRPARGRFEEEPYAPPIDPLQVFEPPSHQLTTPDREDDESG